MPKKKDLDGDISTWLKTVVEKFEREDAPTREYQIRKYRRLKLYWNNMSRIYWSETARDYRLAGITDDSGSTTDDQQAYYDRPINVFQAFLQTIIAALSIQIPGINCVPDDADNPLDISTADAGDKIAELVYKHNNAIFLWLQALYIYCTEGMVACYSYPKEDKKYGTTKEKKYEDTEIEGYACPECGIRLADEIFTDLINDEYMPGDDEVALHDETLNLDQAICPECAAMLDPNMAKTKLIVPRFVGMINKPKARICLEVYGGLYVKVANYAKKQEDTPYLIQAYETHYANVLEVYPNLRDKIDRGGNPVGGLLGVRDPYEQYARQNTEYGADYPEDNVTVRNAWLRPAAFNVLGEEQYKALKKEFPDGCKVVLVNDQVADYENESLDDCWTLTRNPTSDYLTHEPLGELLTNVQDITNDLISLTLQTIEHGVVQTFADPSVVNFNGQAQIESNPGMITAVLAQGGKNISDGFYGSTAATLSPEVFNFYRIIQELGQFVSGALPSLFGGSMPSKGSSRTASEYAMSKSMALQRLQTPWKMLTIWWKEIFGKVVPAYMKEITEDERYVEKDENGKFVNVFIRKAEITGKIGDIELEASDKMPITDEQKAELVMELMQLNNQEIMAAFVSPENLPFIRKIVKMPEFRLPGEADRQKQLEEITMLLASQPIELPPDPAMETAARYEGQQPPMPVTEPSVPIDIDVDNHEIEAAICRSWLVSAAGRLAKLENSGGYQNVLLHYKAHLMQVQLAAAQAAMEAKEQDQNNNTPGDKPGNPDAKKGVKGEKDAITPIS